jgi:hypothetical protein
MSSPYFPVVFLFSYSFFFLDVVFSFVLTGLSRGTESVNCLFIVGTFINTADLSQILSCFGLRVSRLNRPHLPLKRLWGGWGEIYGVLFYQLWAGEMMGQDKMARTKMGEEVVWM